MVGLRGIVVNTTEPITIFATSSVEYETWLVKNLKDNEEVAKGTIAHKSEQENVDMTEAKDEDDDDDDDGDEYEDSDAEDSNFDIDAYDDEDEDFSDE